MLVTVALWRLKCKMDSIPVIVLSGLMDDQKKAYRLADNRLPMNAGWDEDLLRMELSGPNQC